MPTTSSAPGRHGRGGGAGRSPEPILALGAVLLVLTVLLAIAFAHTVGSYGDAMRMAERFVDAAGNDARSGIALHFVAELTGAQDMLFLKGASLIVAAVLIVAGGVFVQRGLRAWPSAAGGTPPLGAVAPGLLLIALGAVLVGIVILTPTRPGLDLPPALMDALTPRRSI